MYKRVKIKKLGRTRTHRDSLIRNQLRSLFTTGHLTTTSVKAKVLKLSADRMIGKVKRASDDLGLFRDLTTQLGTRELVDAAIKYAKGTGPMVKIMKVGYRDGDNAQVSKVELVGFEPVKKQTKKTKRTSKKAEKTVKTEKKSAEPEIHAKKGQPRSIGASIREALGGRQERARSRSGI